MAFAGYMCEVENPKQLIDLAKKVNDFGYVKYDTYSPFPVHGIEKAMGIKRSIVPILSLIGCLIGLTAAFSMQIWMNGIDYAIPLSGKPYAAIPAFIPVAFELTILFTAFFTVFGMFGLNKLPTYNKPEFSVKSFSRSTCDGFFLAISSKDKNFDEMRTYEFLNESGGMKIERIDDE